MAVSRDNGCLEMWRRAVDFVGKPPTRMAVVDLGNQKAKSVPGELPGMRRVTSLTAMWRWFGADAVCIDRNGRDGALPLDLSEPVPEKLHGRFDMLTDFGTLEHVAADQERAWQNAHDLVRPGGVMVHCLPDPETRPWHGVWAYTVEWMQDLAKRCRYDVLHCERWFKKTNDAGQEWYVRAIFVKHARRSSFVGPWVQPVGRPE